MRNIEYRAWLKDEKKMVDVISITFESKCIMYYDKETDTYIWGQDFCDIELMQYTGLTDKNGTKIFEGDIVTLVPNGLPFVLKQNDTAPELVLMDGGNKIYITNKVLQEAFVIGNIYDNPELLGESK